MRDLHVLLNKMNSNSPKTTSTQRTAAFSQPGSSQPTLSAELSAGAANAAGKKKRKLPVAPAAQRTRKEAAWRRQRRTKVPLRWSERLDEVLQEGWTVFRSVLPTQLVSEPVLRPKPVPLKVSS